MESEDRREARAQSRLGLWLGFGIVVLVLLVAFGLAVVGAAVAAGLTAVS